MIKEEVVLATKFNTNKYFKDQKDDIKVFLKENNINFHEKDDLHKMAKFLETLI